MKEFVAINNDFNEYNNIPGVTLIKVDRNGTHHYHDTKCPRCGGKGYLPGLEYIDGGVCFMCGGSGCGSTNFVVYTIEYAKKLEERRLEKARRNSSEVNKKYFKEIGLSENGEAWIVFGETYGIKEELKKHGAKFNYFLGWHFDHEQTMFPTFKLSKDTVIGEGETFLTENIDGTLRVFDEHEIRFFLDGITNPVASYGEREYVGEIGNKIECNVTFVNVHSFDGRYGTTYLYKFEDCDKNVLIWKTAKEIEGIVPGKAVRIIGTVKEHSTFRGTKQTIMNRCKIVTD